MKWIKTFEAFNFDFDLYKEISYLEFRELCRRKIINPTQEKLEEIYQKYLCKICHLECIPFVLFCFVAFVIDYCAVFR